MTSELESAAVNYAKSGWWVFPLKPRDKTPITAHGLQDASNKMDVVRQWWGKWPDANIGLNCGKSGMVVVDLDKRGGYDGLKEWEEIQTQNGIHSHTSTSLTGGGGRHLLFKSPDGLSIKNSAGKLAPGIDVRAEGGYVVLPPSIHPSGNAYAWEASTDIETLPDSIVRILTTVPDPWKIYTLLDAQQPRPPLEWIVDGVITAGSLSIWYGAPGTLKSMLLADLSICVSAGLTWLTKQAGGGGYATRQGPVLWLDFDNGSRRTHERFGALARARNVSSDAPLFYVSMPNPYLDAGDSESMGALAHRIISRDIGLVVIDNLGIVSANIEENSAEMQRPIGALRWLAESTGAAVIVVHHQRKSNGDTKGRAGDTLRGHGSIEAGIDLGMLVTRDQTNISMTATKVRGVDVEKFGATFSFENDEHHELTTARFWPYNPADEDKAAQSASEENIIGELKEFGAMSANQTYDRVGGNRSEVLDLLRQMVKAGRIGQRQGTRGMLLYAIP